MNIKQEKIKNLKYQQKLLRKPYLASQILYNVDSENRRLSKIKEQKIKNNIQSSLPKKVLEKPKMRELNHQPSTSLLQ